jgi:hypothetical protein
MNCGGVKDLDNEERMEGKNSVRMKGRVKEWQKELKNERKNERLREIAEDWKQELEI